MNIFLVISPIRLLFAYLIVINLITILVFAFDKARSRTNKSRIPEKTLLILVLVGGSPAALYAMNTFRHKTKKYSFQIPLYTIVLMQLIVTILILRHFSFI